MKLFSRSKNQGPRTATIIGTNKQFEVPGKDSILNEALAAGIAFPHSCTVGTCGTCKSKLLHGRVREIVDSAIALTAQELRDGYILPCQSIARTSIEGRGALIQVADMQQAIDVANRIAPEHLELSVAEPEQWLPQIRHAGAIFMGRYTAEALGDYCAGPNHVLPTSGTARFSSPLGVCDFQKRSSIINCSAEGASTLGKVASVLARGESLTAHARSAEYRIKGKLQASSCKR